MTPTASREVGDATRVVRRPDEVTSSWLNEILWESGRLDRSAEVATFTTEPVGTGQMADTIRFHLSYAQPESGPATVVAKFASADPQSHATGKAMRAYEIEVRFYAEVAPVVDARVPGCISCAFDPEEAWFTLVLDDIVGATQGDQIEGCTPEVASAVVREMAALQGSSFGSPVLERSGWLNRSTPDSDAFTASVVASVYPAFVERYGDQLSPEHRELFDAFIPQMEQWFALRGGPRTIVHGDLRLDNLLFTQEPRPVIVDFQTMNWGNAGYDLAYFVGGCLTPEIRHACEENLIADYHDALEALGVTGYSIDDLKDDYRRECFGGVMMAVGASMLVKQTRRGDQMFLTSATRHAQHAIDLDALAVLS